jgi:RNA polymerase sigma-70 factor (sigma-E family)
VAYRVCGSDSDAKDLAQDALVRAYGRWQQVAAYSDPNAWIARVVTNLAFDQWRRRRLFRHLPVEARREAAQDDHVDLYLALNALPRRQRQVVVLRYLADQTEAATAETMGCSVGAVKQHASRGLRSLRARLDLPSPSEESS